MDTHPENTIPAFQAAIEAGAHMIEFDVWLTKDGKMVVIHDPTVDRTTNGKGKIADLLFEEIKALDAGSWKSPEFKGVSVPSLEEVLTIMPKNIWLNIHLKEEGKLPALVAKLIQDTDRVEQSFLACSGTAAVQAKKIVPELKICNMDRKSTNDQYALETIQLHSEFIQLPKTVGPISVSNLKLLKENGIKINYFQAGQIQEADSLLSIGIDFPLVNDIIRFMDASKELGLSPVIPIYEDPK